MLGVLVGDPAVGSSQHLEGRFPGGCAALVPLGPPGTSGQDTGAPCSSLGFPVACRRAWQQPLAVGLGQPRKGLLAPSLQKEARAAGGGTEGTLRERSWFPQHLPVLGRGSPGGSCPGPGVQPPVPRESAAGRWTAVPPSQAELWVPGRPAALGVGPAFVPQPPVSPLEGLPRESPGPSLEAGPGLGVVALEPRSLSRPFGRDR